MKKRKGDDEKKHDKCLRCDLVPCVDFYLSTEKLEGGEIHVLEGIIKERLHVPCEIGNLIYSLCKLTTPFTEFLSYPLFLQCVRDLKASAFLLMCGHYRSSMQILRPVIENMLAGVYFDAKIILAKNEREKKETQEAYNRFCKGQYEIPDQEWSKLFHGEKRRKRYLDSDFLLTWMMKENIISGKSKNFVNKLTSMLNKYLHPHYPFTEMVKPDCPRCPASVRYDEDEYRRCVQFFQDVITILLETVYVYTNSYFPEKLGDEEIQDALGTIKSLEGLEKDIKVPLIYSKELREFISALPPLPD